jgi:plasmid stabilization system protein ParE
MSRLRVVLTENALDQLEQIDAWWHTNRPKNPTLVEAELREAIQALSAQPEAGTIFARRGVRGVRRLLLPRSQYYVYYRVNRDEKQVQIVAVWRTSRKKGPPL